MKIPFTSLFSSGAARFVTRLAIIAAFFPLFSSCASRPVVIPDDMPPAKLIQRAQEASDTNKYSISLQYYEALQERYGNEAEYLCTAEYEIAFIRYKQKRYSEARAGLEKLHARYDDEDAALLPPHFKILAEKVLSKITEKGF